MAIHAVTILGAGGHAKEILDILLLQSFTDIELYDSYTPEEGRLFLERYPILTSQEALQSRLSTYPDFIVAVGSPGVRKALYEEGVAAGGRAYSCIAPSAVVSRLAPQLGAGLNIMAHSFVSASSAVGQGSLVNAGAYVMHDAQVGSYVELAPGAKLLGACRIGDFCRVGANATILPKVKLASSCEVGAGSVVDQDWPTGSKLSGVPARPLNS